MNDIDHECDICAHTVYLGDIVVDSGTIGIVDGAMVQGNRNRQEDLSWEPGDFTGWGRPIHAAWPSGAQVPVGIAVLNLDDGAYPVHAEIVNGRVFTITIDIGGDF